jgi:hypothetical protein
MTVWANVLIMTLFFLVALHYYAGRAEGTHGFFYVFGNSIWRAFVTFFSWGHYAATKHIMIVSVVTCLELAIITAFAVLFSSFSTPTLSMFFTILTFIAGRLNEDIIRFADQVARNAASVAKLGATAVHLPLSYYLALGAAHLVPNLGAFHRTVEQAIYESKVEIWYGTILYGVAYTIGILSLSILIFNRRNFK